MRKLWETQVMEETKWNSEMQQPKMKHDKHCVVVVAVTFVVPIVFLGMNCNKPYYWSLRPLFRNFIFASSICTCSSYYTACIFMQVVKWLEKNSVTLHKLLHIPATATENIKRGLYIHCFYKIVELSTKPMHYYRRMHAYIPQVHNTL